MCNRMGSSSVMVAYSKDLFFNISATLTVYSFVLYYIFSVAKLIKKFISNAKLSYFIGYCLIMMD